MKFVDIHTHPLKTYYENPYQAVSNSLDKSVAFLGLTGCDLNEDQEILNLISLFKKENEKVKKLFGVIGIHPNNSTSLLEIKKLELLINEDVKAIGEIGLDYSRDNNPPKELQKQIFEAQINLAIKYKLPVVIHLRDAEEDVYEILKKYKEANLKFVIHTFSQDLEYAKKIYDLGGYFSFSGVCTYKNANKTREVIKWVPLDRIFSETDAPYLTPFPHRGEINYSNYVRYTVFFMAGLKNISPDELAQKIYKNTKRFFNLYG
ncbi:TatD family hydrolase [Mycoplasma phocimorsus]|uniref:TatD family hydrolase n=1 Tax=Mycoplasma phocimorsus TaxID=3045839 RepID=A0AAJ1UWS1_9MOLU|nr:TatD family hydrolase [Mycoplasma phocimorsus]MDJ1645750.1 TatD family hydrolase [Mycoplasma phocimorsus]MDJ1647244.1 TatD family hydrolase [Mycoplasma phocimorsus]MDJ1647892.1 TatD family hydrolase [Mycoplasma phocimorsus]MDJ1648400.1 TatD family hydrolase [Mycoplasma phocimorsus]